MTEYAFACAPPRWRILGVRLAPLTLGHVLALHRIASPFVLAPPPRGEGRDGGEPNVSVSLDDFLAALRICSAPRSPLRFPRFFIRFSCWLKPWLLPVRIVLFQQYLVVNLAMPDVWRPESGENPPCNAPWAANLKRRLMTELGYTATETLALPIAQANYEIAVLREARGELQFVSETERAVLNGERGTGNGEPLSAERGTRNGEQSECHPDSALRTLHSA